MANLLTKTLSKLLPQPTYVGPNWIKFAKPPRESLTVILDYEFKNLLSAHGRPIKEDAHVKLKNYLNNYNYN